MRLDTCNYQIDAMCLNLNMTVTIYKLLLPKSNKKSQGCLNFSLSCREVIALLCKNV